MTRDQRGVGALVKLAELLGTLVVDLGARMNFPNRRPLAHRGRRRALVREVNAVLLLKVADPWDQFNSFSDLHKLQRFAAKTSFKVINLSVHHFYICSNYQDFQRYPAVNLSIDGDAQASLPALTERVHQLMTSKRMRSAPEHRIALEA